MSQVPTYEHHLGQSSGGHAMRHDYASSITGARTRWWWFDPSYSNTPAWVGTPILNPTNFWMLMYFRIMPGSNYCGRILDGHSEVSDSDIQDHAALPGGGVSAFAIDHGPGSDQHGSWSGITYTAEPEGDDHGNIYHWTVIPESSLVYGARYRLKININLGRRGSSNPGSIKIWALDFDPVNPVVNLSGISTIWANQSVMHFFQGPYLFGSNTSVQSVIQMMATRFGLTEQDAYADGVARQIFDTGDVAGAGPNDYDLPVNPYWDTVDFGQFGGGGGGGGGAGTAGKTAIGASYRPVATGTKFVEKKITVPAGKYWRIDDLKAYIRGSSSVAGTENLKPIIAADAAGVPSTIEAVGTPASTVGAVGGSTPTYVGRGTPVAAVTASQDFTFPVGAAAGDLAHFFGFFRSGIIPTVPSGWTAKVSAFDQGTSKLWLIEKVLSSGDISTGKVTINTDFSAYYGGYVETWRGASGTEAVVNANNNNTSLDPPSVTSLGANRRMVWYLDASTTGQTLAAPSGTTAAGSTYDSGAEELVTLYHDQAVAGSTDPAAITYGGSAWGAIGLALIPSGSGSADPAAWKTFNMGTPILSPGDHWIGFITSGTDLAAELAYDAGAAGSTQKNTDAGYSSIAIGSAFGGSLTGTTDVASIYVDYTEVAAPTNLFTGWGSIPI